MQPHRKPITGCIDKAYAKYKDLKEGKNADYIKELATLIRIFTASRSSLPMARYIQKVILHSTVSIQSYPKYLHWHKVIEEQGAKAVMDKIGVDATVPFQFHCCN